MGAPGFTCRCCGFVAKSGQDWGYLDGPSGPGFCDHVSAMRYCPCCSERWWRPGLEADWDVDGCAHEDCPDCVAWLASPDGIEEMARQRAAAVAS